ncbi:cation:proton antiporter [Microbulbifer guangxiensis]|uniref:cation:proton antiporter n=1 Tax=Microbulbifer guangxiensis TaxID=2904249 RepID=UPI001F30C598|nr:sodium:proton antiporter [Microbulbifer guangxiensis]
MESANGVITLVGQGLYMALAAVVGLALARILRTDNTLGCLIAGVLAGMLLPAINFDTGLRAHNMRELVFFVILPVLIFEAAWQIEPAVLKRWLGPVLLFSTLGVLISAILIGLLTYYGIDRPQDFPWIAAFLTGVILAATDPVSVVNKLRTGESGEDLITLVEGESLFNDAAAIVLYSLTLGVALHTVMEGGASTGDALEGYGAVTVYFLATFFGGLAVGLVCGLLTAIVVLFLRSAGAALVVLLLAAFGSFYLAERMVHVSGILAVMTCGIVARACLREQRDTFLAHAAPTWEWLSLMFSALIFVIMGLVITWEMFSERWLAMIIAVAAAVGARALTIFMLAPAARFIGPPIPKEWRLVMGWGGLRGVVAVALVLSLPEELPYWWTIQSMVFGVVLFSLLVQGTTCRWLLNKPAVGATSSESSKDT